MPDSSSSDFPYWNKTKTKASRFWLSLRQIREFCNLTWVALRGQHGKCIVCHMWNLRWAVRSLTITQQGTHTWSHICSLPFMAVICRANSYKEISYILGCSPCSLSIQTPFIKHLPVCLGPGTSEQFRQSSLLWLQSSKRACSLIHNQIEDDLGEMQPGRTIKK